MLLVTKTQVLEGGEGNLCKELRSYRKDSEIVRRDEVRDTTGRRMTCKYHT